MHELAARVSILIFCPLLIGACIKVADDLNDLAALLPVRGRSIPLAVFAAGLIVAMVVFDHRLLVIVVSVYLALVFTGKIDNLAFYLFSIVFIGGLVAGAAFGFIDAVEQLTGLWFYIGLVAIIALGVADEVGNDLLEKRGDKGWPHTFFRWRCTLKVGVPLVAWMTHAGLGLGPWEVVAFWMFDLGYFIGEVLVSRQLLRECEGRAG